MKKHEMAAFSANRRMERDPENHTRWKHKWRWHSGGNLWDKIDTE